MMTSDTNPDEHGNFKKHLVHDLKTGESVDQGIATKSNDEGKEASDKIYEAHMKFGNEIR